MTLTCTPCGRAHEEDMLMRMGARKLVVRHA
jgi:ribosomal protein L44E